MFNAYCCGKMKDFMERHRIIAKGGKYHLVFMDTALGGNSYKTEIEIKYCPACGSDID